MKTLLIALLKVNMQMRGIIYKYNSDILFVSCKKYEDMSAHR
jgi:hypothetical protein